MNLTTKTPKQALNKAFLKQRPSRDEIDLFKANLKTLLGKINERESEEHHKNFVRDFLKETFYKAEYEINTKGRQDLVIHIGKNADDKVGVILEAKKPTNKVDMISASRPNKKALHELILYFLRERIDDGNNDIKYLIVTNIYEWFIFDANNFNQLFFDNKSFVKEYKAWRSKQKVTSDTNLFYKEIAKPYVDTISKEIPCTYFNIRDYGTALTNGDPKDDERLVELFKILSPFHLLKVPFAEDSNKLDRNFYTELLHIIGLEEIKDSGKLQIQRKAIERRNEGSLIENAIAIIETKDSLHNIKNIERYGTTQDERLFNVALELSLTWINRVLFLKLLEAQLVNYHKGNRDYRFLDTNTIPDYDELFTLFHQVLSKLPKERRENIREKYQRVPYLNSSLFEISELETQTITIESLKDTVSLPLINTSVLSEQKAQRAKLPPLEYLLRFLDAYDFASEGAEGIKESNRSLINASVLGKVFEKINNAKAGSIYTPGFITMYMCRQSIRLAVVQKFKDKYGWDIADFTDIKNYLADYRSKQKIIEFNELINSLRICDPAVGSGHFLVSSLNEIIAIKYELGVLADENGERFGDIEITIDNDELLIFDTKIGGFFKYQIQDGKPQSKEAHRLQKTIFNEKQTIIENCLFGVDIIPHSVKICRLRLWIELLKNAYYKDATNYTELETLPNIDINIKEGNALISRFKLNDRFRNEKMRRWMNEYSAFVNEYKSVKSSQRKNELKAHIDEFHNVFSGLLEDETSSLKEKLKKKQRALAENQNELFADRTEVEKEIATRRFTKEIESLESQIKEVNAKYNNSFEWRYEFPEVLDNEGNFIGFDIIIGNPPYISAIDLKKILPEQVYKYLKTTYQTAKGTVDLFVYFFERGLHLLKDSSTLMFITPNRYLSISYADALREYLFKNTTINEIVDYSDVKVFKEASTYPVITSLSKKKPSGDFYQIAIGKYDEATDLMSFRTVDSKKLNLLEGYVWGYLLNEKIAITERVINQSVSITKCANVNATSTAAEADAYHDLINQDDGFKLINTGTIDKYESLWGKIELKDKGQKYLTPYLPKDSSLISKNRMELYRSPKIILAKIALSTEAFLDAQGEYASINTNCLHSFKKDFNPKYILAWLNSKLFQYTYECFFEGLKMQGGYLPYGSPNISRMYIKKISAKEQKPLVSLVDRIIKLKNQGKATQALEDKIDSLIYSIYGITLEEQAIIEGK